MSDVLQNMNGAMQYSTQGVNNDYVYVWAVIYHYSYILPKVTYQKYYLQIPRYRHTK